LDLVCSSSLAASAHLVAKPMVTAHPRYTNSAGTMSSSLSMATTSNPHKHVQAPMKRPADSRRLIKSFSYGENRMPRPNTEQETRVNTIANTMRRRVNTETTTASEIFAKKLITSIFGALLDTQSSKHNATGDDKTAWFARPPTQNWATQASAQGSPSVSCERSKKGAFSRCQEEGWMPPPQHL